MDVKSLKVITNSFESLITTCVILTPSLPGIPSAPCGPRSPSEHDISINTLKIMKTNIPIFLKSFLLTIPITTHQSLTYFFINKKCNDFI